MTGDCKRKPSFRVGFCETRFCLFLLESSSVLFHLKLTTKNFVIMNWMGGHLAQFKRKRVSKKEEERRRIEEYITKRQKKEVMAGDKHRQETSSSTDLFANPQNPLMITNNSKSTNYDQSALFSRSIDPALVANPWAGIDPNFLKPKVFPSYLKNIPKLYFDAAPGNFTAKSPETVIFSDNSLKQDFNFEASQNGTELPLHFDKNDVYGPVLTPSFSNFSPQVIL